MCSSSLMVMRYFPAYTFFTRVFCLLFASGSVPSDRLYFLLSLHNPSSLVGLSQPSHPSHSYCYYPRQGRRFKEGGGGGESHKGYGPKKSSEGNKVSFGLKSGCSPTLMNTYSRLSCAVISFHLGCLVRAFTSQHPVSRRFRARAKQALFSAVPQNFFSLFCSI